MINNRQNGRRRGRGGQQVRNGQPGVPDRGNRLDNRARGNAAQLLEKYKSLARDAQMVGDRVNTEYFLQFADHYFRVLAETRSRFEDNRPQRRDEYRDDFNGEDGGDDEAMERADRADNGRGYAPANGGGWQGDEEDGGEAARYDEPRAAPEPRRVPDRRQAEAEPREAPAMRDEGPRYQDRRPRRDDRNNNGNGNPRARAESEPSSGGTPIAAAMPNDERDERIEIDRLPAGFGTAPEPATDDGEARPRRRTRRPRPETAGTAEV